MRNTIIVIIATLIIIAIAFAAYYFGVVMREVETVEVVTEPEIIENRTLTEAEQLEILNELQPEDTTDTPEERQRDIDILDQLMNQ